METIENGLRVYTLYAECKAGTSFKFYQCQVRELEEGRGQFVVSYGRIGSNGQKTDYGQFHSYEEAKGAANEQFKLKLNKGYEQVNPLQALASTMLEPEDLMDARNYVPIDVEIPKWESGSDDFDRKLTSAAEKIVKKLNLVNSSKSEYKQGGHQSQEKFRKELSRVAEMWRTSYRRATHGYETKFWNSSIYWKTENFYRTLCDKFSIRPSNR